MNTKAESKGKVEKEKTKMTLQEVKKPDGLRGKNKKRVETPKILILL